MPSLAELAETLRQVATPGIKPKELVAVVRKKHPEATKKEIVRAAFFSLSDGYEADQAQSGELHDFAIKERATDEGALITLPKRKKRDRKKAVA